MDVQQFQYYVTIVEENFNLSNAAKNLLVSQSALSKYILTFEKQHGVSLFIRKKGRLTELTRAGEIVYQSAKRIVEEYEHMMVTLSAEALKESGELHIGIPPLFWNLGFTNVINQFRTEFPNIKLKIIERGGDALIKKFLRNELNFALLVWTKDLIQEPVKLHKIAEDDLVAFFFRENPLKEKEQLSWSDLNQKSLALFDESFSIYQMVKEKLNSLHVSPRNIVTTQYWDYLLRSVEHTDYITIMPRPVLHLTGKEHIMRPFEDPLTWNVCLAEHTDRQLTSQETLFRDYAITLFDIKQTIADA